MTKNNKFWEEIENVMAETLYPVPGDIVSLGTHCGIYIGHGQLIHYPRHAGSIRKDFLTKLGQNGSIAFSIKREAPESETKPLPADEIVQRAESMVGKTKEDLKEISNSMDFANWCRYATAAPVIVDASFDAPKVIAKPFLCGNWDEKCYKAVSALGIEEIIKDACIAFNKREEERKKAPEYGLLKILFGSSRRENDRLENYYIVCLKEQTVDRGYYVSCFLLDKETNRSVAESILVWQTEWLEEDLQKVFGARNMCILS